MPRIGRRGRRALIRRWAVRASLAGAGVLTVLLLLVVAPRRGDAQASAQTETPDTWFSGGRAALEQARNLRNSGDRARHVILFVGDGMGLSTVAAARILEGQMRGQSGEENQLAFERLPYVALSKTYSVNQQVAESSATATAMLTGVKTKDDVLALDQGATADEHATATGHELTTLLELAERAGLSTGIVTTARLTHATPAAAYAHTVNRDWEDDAALPDRARSAGYPDIARQFVEFREGDGLEVAFGGGRSQFLPKTEADPEYPARTGNRLDGRQLAREWADARRNAQWIWNRAQFDAIDVARTEHVLGLFEPSHMQYAYDRPRDGAGEPSLTEMTVKAIDILSKNQRGSFLLVEAGRIDLAHHAGNAFRALTDTIELSSAVRAALTRTNTRDTLVVVTADHSHTLTMGGYSTRGNPILGKVIINDVNGRPLPTWRRDLLGLPFTTLSYTSGPGYAGVSNLQPEGPKRFPHVPNASGNTRLGRPDLTGVDTTDPDYLQESMLPLGNETHAGEDVAIYAGGPAAHLFHGVMEQHVIFHVLAHALRLGR